MSPRFWAVVPAAGVGKRMGAAIPKQYLDIAGQTVLHHTLERLLAVDILSGVYVALGAEDGYWPDVPLARHPRIHVAPGGRERADSVYSALITMAPQVDEDDWVLVHDAARPCLTGQDVIKLIDTLRNDPVGGILALPVSDTLKTVSDGLITGTPDRSHVWRALTPQMFRYGLLRRSLEQAAERQLLVTDEASAIELAGHQPRIVEGRSDNLKITRPEDVSLAAFYLERQCYE